VSGGIEILGDLDSIREHPGHSEGAEERKRWAWHLGRLTTHRCAESEVAQSAVMINHGLDLRHLGVVETVSPYDDRTPRGCEKDRSVPIASTIAEFKFITRGTTSASSGSRW